MTVPKTITLTSIEIAQSIQDCLGTIVQTVRAVLEKTPPELASDVIDRGIVLTGGGALLRHLDELLTQETGVPCCACAGSGRSPGWCVVRPSMALRRRLTFWATWGVTCRSLHASIKPFLS